MGDPVQSHPRVGRGLHTTTAAPILTAQNKKGSLGTSGVWATQPAAGKSAPVPRALPSILASPLFLFLPGAVCSARQNNVKQGPDQRPKPPWTNRFHLRPTFLDAALTNRVGIKPSANNEVKLYKKKKPRKQGQTGALIICWERWAIVPPESLDCAALTHSSMQGCRMYYGNAVQLAQM